MIHLGKNTRSRIIAKGIAAGRSNSTYRGLVKISPKAQGARNHAGSRLGSWRPVREWKIDRTAA